MEVKKGEQAACPLHLNRSEIYTTIAAVNIVLNRSDHIIYAAQTPDKQSL